MRTVTADDLLEKFIEELLLPFSYYDFENVSSAKLLKEKKLSVDDSDYEVVDGEEGDNGFYRYYDETGELIAVYENEGGDIDGTKFTQAGIELYTPVINDLIQQKINGMRLVPSAKLD